MIFYIIFILPIVFFTYSIGQSDKNGLMANHQERVLQEKQNIIFDFSAKYLETFSGGIEVVATLYNTTSDSIYFLTSSCSGEQYSLRYDTSKIELYSIIHCNTSYPILKTIAPKSKYEFKAFFRYKAPVLKKIKLGFDFYKVDKSINLKNVKLSNIFHRDISNQNIILAEEKEIQ